MKTEDKTEDDIILSALEREHTRLKKIADQAKSMCEKRLSAATQLVEIHSEAYQIMCGETGSIDFERLKELKKSANKAKKLMKLDLIKLSDKEFEAEWERDLAARALANHKFLMAMRRGQ